MEQPDVSVEEVWSLDNGVLACRGTPRGYIYTEGHYSDFTLTFQWRWPEGEKPGKGGVLFRMSGPHCIWPTSLEAQLNSGDAGDFWGLAGFTLSGPRERMKAVQHDTLGRLINVKKTENLEKEPGGWNACEIIARGEEVVIRLNGEEVSRAHGCDLTEGPLCLTAEGNPIQFRNIRLKE